MEENVTITEEIETDQLSFSAEVEEIWLIKVKRSVQVISVLIFLYLPRPEVSDPTSWREEVSQYRQSQNMLHNEELSGPPAKMKEENILRGVLVFGINGCFQSIHHTRL